MLTQARIGVNTTLQAWVRTTYMAWRRCNVHEREVDDVGDLLHICARWCTLSCVNFQIFVETTDHSLQKWCLSRKIMIAATLTWQFPNFNLILFYLSCVSPNLFCKEVLQNCGECMRLAFSARSAATAATRRASSAASSLITACAFRSTWTTAESAGTSGPSSRRRTSTHSRIDPRRRLSVSLCTFCERAWRRSQKKSGWL